MMILEATAADTAVTIGIGKSQAGVLQTVSPALAPKPVWHVGLNGEGIDLGMTV